MDESERLQQLVNDIQDLPTLPSVVTRIISMVEDPSTSAEDVNAVISQDPALTAKVLKLVNSPFYGFSRRISTVTEAVVILGFNTVKSLALSASVFEVFEGEGSERFDRVGLWEHSIATGVAAEMVGKHIEFEQVEEVMVGGILHAIGKIVEDIYFREDIGEILDFVEQNDCLMVEAERAVLGVGHPQIGGWLADTWNLPSEIAAGIGYYHRPMEGPEEHRGFASIIHIGDILARTKNLGWTGDDVIPNFLPEVWDQLGLRKDDIQRFLNQLESEYEDAEVFLELSAGSGGQTTHG